MFEKIRYGFIAVIICIIFFAAGYLVHRTKIFPFDIIEKSGKNITSVFKKKWYYRPTSMANNITINNPNLLNWPVLITSIDNIIELRYCLQQTLLIANDLENNITVSKSNILDVN